MRYGLSLFLFAVLAASLALPQSDTPAPKTTTPVKKKAAPKTASATKKTTSSKKTVASKKGKASKKQVAAASVSRQMVPTPERYKEIQQALVEKGYLKSEPNGVWDAQSTDALRQFQTDKQLSPTGKLSSASLIALGLGPKTAAAPSAQPAAPVETPPTVPAPAN